jgi:transposase InsO family protein
VDHCSTFLVINHQLTANASDAICGKLLIEREAADVVVSIKGYHSDNGVFNSAEFCSPCSDLGQSLHFNGVGAIHQNGVAERTIQTITNMACADMLHATLHWPE